MKFNNMILKTSLLMGLIYGPANALDQSCNQHDLDAGCQNLQVSYDPSETNTTMSGNHTLCTGQYVTGHLFPQGERNVVCVQGSSTIEVGPRGTKTDYVGPLNITQTIAKENIKGANTLKAFCHGTAGLSSTNCETSVTTLPAAS